MRKFQLNSFKFMATAPIPPQNTTPSPWDPNWGVRGEGDLKNQKEHTNKACIPNFSLLNKIFQYIRVLPGFLNFLYFSSFSVSYLLHFPFMAVTPFLPNSSCNIEFACFYRLYVLLFMGNFLYAPSNMDPFFKLFKFFIEK